MRRLLSLIALCLALVLGAAPTFAADADHGAQIFSANCAACHMGGGNVVNAERTLKGTVLVGELGLGGQLRPVGQLEARLQEAARLGFRRAVVPKGSGLGRLAAGLDLELREAGSVAEAFHAWQARAGV